MLVSRWVLPNKPAFASKLQQKGLSDMSEIKTGSAAGIGVVSVLLLLGLTWLTTLAPATAQASGQPANSTAPQQGSPVGTGLTSSDHQMRLDAVLAVAQPMLAEPGRSVVQLSLQDSIARALRHNLDIRVSGYQPAIRLTEVTEAEAAFDAILFGSAQGQLFDQANSDSILTNELVQVGSTLQNVLTPSQPYTNAHDYQYNLGLRKRLAHGGTIEFSQRLRRFRDLRGDEIGLSFNPFYEYGLQLQLSQPLLRDFGIDVNRATIDVRRNNYRVSRQQFALEVINTVTEVESNYWTLVLARQRAKVFRALVDEAELSLARMEARRVLDASAEIVYQNRELIKRSQANLVGALNDVKLQQDRLLESLNDPNLPINEDWEIIPENSPTMRPYHVDRAEALQTALRLRPEIIAQQLQVESAEIIVGLSENQALPRLDLFAQQEITGAGDSYNSAWDQQWRADTINYLLGISFEWPVANRAALAGLSRTRYQQRQEKLTLENVQQQVLADVSMSTHEIENKYAELVERRDAAQAATGTLEAYLAMEATDAVTTPSFLDRKLNAHERLATALLTALQTISRYNIAITNIHRAQGTLLHYNNIKLSELPQP